MAKKNKEDRPHKNPKEWENAETKHDIEIGTKVKVESFGNIFSGWEVIEQMTHPEFGLACYKLKSTDGTKYPYIGRWMNPNMHIKIIA